MLKLQNQVQSNSQNKSSTDNLPPSLSELIGKYDKLSDISSEDNYKSDEGFKIVCANPNCREEYISASGTTTLCPDCREKEEIKDDDSEEGFKIICANPNCREEYISASGTTTLCPDCR
jgi:hypothetical protein